MSRILVIGTSGSGKSTLAQRLSTLLEIPYFASDPFYWEPGWQAASPTSVRARVEAVVCQEHWVLDGNFDADRDLVWRSADCIIWLDYPLVTAFLQVTTRNLGWWLSGQPTWSGNRMTLRKAFSGIRHALRSHPGKRRNYPVWLAELSGITIHRFQSHREADAWVQNLT